MSEDVKLEPCPFCDGAAETFRNHPLSGTTSEYYGCRECQVFRSSVEDWNRRAKPTPGPATRAALEQITRSLRQMEPSPRDYRFGLRPAFAVVIEDPEAYLAEMRDA